MVRPFLNENHFRAIFLSLLVLTLFSCGKDSREKGIICLRQGDTQRAVYFLEQAVLENPQDLYVRKALAQAYLQDTLWQKALQEYRVVYSQGDSSIGEEFRQAWLQWSQKLTERGDSSQAMLELEKAMQWFPRSVDVINDAALLAYRRSSWERSEEYWRAAITLDSHSITAPFNLGMAYWMRGDAQSALECWVTAFERNPLDTNVVSWMVEARKALGK